MFPSARSAFHAYPGCFYPISVLPGFIRRSRKIFPPPLCGRLVLLDARKAGGGGAGGNTSFEFPVNSSFTISSNTWRRSATTSMNINPSTDRPHRLLQPRACNYRGPRVWNSDLDPFFQNLLLARRALTTTNEIYTRFALIYPALSSWKSFWQNNLIYPMRYGNNEGEELSFYFHRYFSS